MRATDNARKPESIPLRFEAGASSARLHGTASLGWGDIYAFSAAAGQRIVVRAIASRAHVSLVLFPENGDAAIPSLQANRPFTLRKGGAYKLDVETDSEDDVAYALTLEIR